MYDGPYDSGEAYGLLKRMRINQIIKPRRNTEQIKDFLRDESQPLCSKHLERRKVVKQKVTVGGGLLNNTLNIQAPIWRTLHAKHENISKK